MRIFLTYILIILTQFIFAQGHIFTTVKFNKKSVYIGEPIEVTVSVYTSTWFTKGVNPGNIKVDGAFSYYFRSVSMSRKINNKTYAGVEMLYYVIPFEDEDIIFPTVTFKVETPDVDDYVGKNRTIKTKAKTIKIKSIPRGFSADKWLVTSSLSVNERWIGNIKDVKVGDVLERRISRNVAGTVSELIPQVIWDSISGVSLYPSASSVKNHKSKTYISSERTDAVRYLFEKEGEVIIPEMVLTYWNPYRNRQYKRTIKSTIINVLPNPNLGILKTMRDSLNSELPINAEELSEEKEFEFMGLSLKQLIFYSVTGIIIFYIIFRFLKWLFISKMIIQKLVNRRKNYLKSEKYAFRKLYFSLLLNNKEKQSIALYKWIDTLGLKEPTIQFIFNQYLNINSLNDINYYDKSKLKEIRKLFLCDKTKSKKDNKWINP